MQKRGADGTLYFSAFSALTKLRFHLRYALFLLKISFLGHGVTLVE